MEIKVQLENGTVENGNENEIQFINENKRPFENWKENSIKIMKIDKWRTKKKAVCKTARRAHSQKKSLD